MTSNEIGGYELGDRRYYLGDKKMADSFLHGDASTRLDPLGNTGNFNNTLTSTHTSVNKFNKTLPNSKKLQNFEGTDITKSLPQIDDYEPRELIDYGRDFYNLLRRYHEDRVKSEFCSWQDILETWKILKRSQDLSKSNSHKAKNHFKWENPYERKPHPNKKLSVETQVRLYGKGFFKKETQGKSTNEMRNDLTSGKHYEDVRYTLQNHHQDFEKDKDMEKKMELGLLKRQREIEEKKMKRRMKRRRKKKKKPMTEEAKILMEEKERLKNEEKKYVRLVTQTVEDYHIKHPDNDDFIYPDKLFIHWNHLKKVEKEQLNINLEHGVARETFNNFFSSRIEFIYLEFKKRKGVDSNDPKALYMYYRDGISEKKKREMDFIFYSKKNALNLFRNWCQEKSKEKEEEKKRWMKMVEKEKAEERRKMKKRGKSAQPVSRKEIIRKRKERIKMLSRPKDRLKIGKALLKMKSRFPNDRILREMIVDEFQTDKIAKRPLEYDNYDSDEEIAIKQKHNLAEGLKEDFIDNELSVHRIQRLRERELLNRFSDILKKYNTGKNEELKRKQNYVKRFQKEDKIIRNFLMKKAKAYRKLTLNKMNEKIDSETQFLSDTYHELKKLEPSGTKRVFPHYNKGESKELKKKSYPLNFKHEFFTVFRMLEKEKMRVATKNKLGFWAPAGEKKKKSHNKKIIKNSVEVKFKRVWDQRQKEGIWEEDHFQEERRKILMKLSDAEQCTFQPIIRSRLPNKMKISETEGAYDKPSDPMKALEKKSKNLKTLKLQKKGAFRKALYEYVHGKGPIIAYAILCENFNVAQIREELGDPKKDKPPKKGTKLYYILNPLAKEKEKEAKEKKEKEEKEAKKEGEAKADNPFAKIMANVKGKRKEEDKTEKKEEKKEKTEEEKKLDEKEKRKQEEYAKKRQELFKKALNIIARPTIQEDMKDLVFKNFLYDVLDLILIIESHQREVEKVKKLAKITLEKKDRPVKEFMCPLGEKCPDFESDRWPVSNARGTKPLGKNCPFAHHANELYFKGQKKNREKYLKLLEGKMEHRLVHGELTGNKNLYLPAGTVLTNLDGLKNIKKKEMKKDEADKIPMAGEAKKDKIKRGEKLKKSKKVKKKMEMMKKHDENLRKKLGFLRRSEVLYSQERYKEAFKTIVKAIRIVMSEIEYDEKIEEDCKDRLRDKIDLDYDGNINKEQILKLQQKGSVPLKQNVENPNYDEELEELANEKFQKVILFAEKTGVIGDQRWDVKQNLKDLIEVM